jgi:hypothetical protein
MQLVICSESFVSQMWMRVRSIRNKYLLYLHTYTKRETMRTRMRMRMRENEGKMNNNLLCLSFYFDLLWICIYICVCSLKGGPEFGLNAPYLVVGFVTGEMGFSFTLSFLYFWYDSIILYNIIPSGDSVNYMHALSSESIVQTFLRQLDVMFGNESDWQPGRLIDCSSLLLSMCLIACDYLLWWLRSLLLMEVNFFVCGLATRSYLGNLIFDWTKVPHIRSGYSYPSIGSFGLRKILAKVNLIGGLIISYLSSPRRGCYL